jgi:general secretion pathway protein K
VAYRAANRALTSVSELRMIAGIDLEQYGCLASSLAALPTATGINVNTAGPPVIAALADMMSLETAEEIVRERPDGGYGSMAEFLAQPPLAGQGISPDGLVLESDYFLVNSRSGFGQSEIQMYSLLNRGAAGVKVFNRSIGTY